MPISQACQGHLMQVGYFFLQNLLMPLLPNSDYQQLASFGQQTLLSFTSGGA